MVLLEILIQSQGGPNFIVILPDWISFNNSLLIGGLNITANRRTGLIL